MIGNDTDGKFFKAEWAFSFLSFPISWTVRLVTMLYKRIVLWGTKAEFEGFVSRNKKFGTCSAAVGSQERIFIRRLTI